MKRSLFLTSTLLLLAFGLSGCDFIGDVIEFGLWTLLIIVVALVLVVVALVKVFFD